MELIRIKAVAAEQIKGKRSHTWKERGNKFYHGERVAALALKLRGLIYPDDPSHDDILTAAAWFHDISNGEKEHSQKGAERTRALLKGLCSQWELDEICGIIAVHDDRGGDRSRYTKWIKLHQDADLLDHFGTFDIWMNFIYAVPHDETIRDVRNYLSKERPKDTLRYREQLNYDISKAIYDEKADFLKYFTERFIVESDGGVWKFDDILEKFDENRRS